MALETNHPEVDMLLQEIIEFTGESAPQALTNALKERLDRVRVKQPKRPPVMGELMRIGSECAALPVLDSRTADEILGYNAIGIPA